MRQEDQHGQKLRGTQGTRKEIPQQRREMKAMAKEDLRCNSYAKRVKNQQEKQWETFSMVMCCILSSRSAQGSKLKSIRGELWSLTFFEYDQLTGLQ